MKPVHIYIHRINIIILVLIALIVIATALVDDSSAWIAFLISQLFLGVYQMGVSLVYMIMRRKREKNPLFIHFWLSTLFLLIAISTHYPNVFKAIGFLGLVIPWALAVYFTHTCRKRFIDKVVINQEV